MVLAMVTNPMVLRCLMVVDWLGSLRWVPVSRSTRSSIPSTRASASPAWPWMNSQRGLSGTLRRTSRMTSPSTKPRPKQTRQPTLTGRSLVAGTVSSAPNAARAQARAQHVDRGAEPGHLRLGDVDAAARLRELPGDVADDRDFQAVEDPDGPEPDHDH